MKLAFIERPTTQNIACVFVADFSSVDHATKSVMEDRGFQKNSNGPVVALSKEVPKFLENHQTESAPLFQEVFELGRQYEQKLQEEAKRREDDALRERLLQEGIFD